MHIIAINYIGLHIATNSNIKINDSTYGYMPRLTEEKIESIRKTFQETKSYKITGQIEKVDERTVRKYIREKPQPATASGSFAEKPGEPSRDIIEPVQLEANDLFATGSSIVQVSKALKLLPSVAIQYRKEYDQMVEADLDDELRKKNDQKISLDQTIQEKSKSVQQLERSTQELADSERAYIIKCDVAKNRCFEEEDRQKKMEAEGGVHSFVKNLEALQDSQRNEKLRPLFEAKFFKNAIVRPITAHVLLAMMAHPNKAKLCAKIIHTDDVSFSNPLAYFSETAFNLLVQDTDKRVQTAIHRLYGDQRQSTAQLDDSSQASDTSRGRPLGLADGRP